MKPVKQTNNNQKKVFTFLKYRIGFSILGCFISYLACADVPSGAPKLASYSSPGSSSQMASLVAGLLLIIGLIYGLAWFVKRFSQGGFLQNSAIKIVASLQLGTRERLALVQVGDKQILLGISATQINCLHTFDEPVVQLEEKGSKINSEFNQKLMAILQGKSLVEPKRVIEEKTLQESTRSVDSKKRSTKKNIKE